MELPFLRITITMQRVFLNDLNVGSIVNIKLDSRSELL